MIVRTIPGWSRFAHASLEKVEISGDVAANPSALSSSRIWFFRLELFSYSILSSPRTVCCWRETHGGNGTTLPLCVIGGKVVTLHFSFPSCFSLLFSRLYGRHAPSTAGQGNAGTRFSHTLKKPIDRVFYKFHCFPRSASSGRNISNPILSEGGLFSV